jgi:hypothetical protein
VVVANRPLAPSYVERCAPFAAPDNSVRYPRRHTLVAAGQFVGGNPIDEIVRRAQPKLEASHVLVYAANGYTRNLTLEDFLRPENMLVDRRDGGVDPWREERFR